MPVLGRASGLQMIHVLALRRLPKVRFPQRVSLRLVGAIRGETLRFGWKDKAVHLVYDWKNFQKWYVKKMRGMANSRTYEKAILCWKGKFPSGLPKDRQYVDAGSALYVDTMLKVPVLHPKDLTYVEKSVLGESLKTMCGLSEDLTPEDAVEAPSVAASVADSAASVADSAAEMRPLQDHVKKRKLYRHATEDNVVWFPHDNHPDLLKELVWESGSPRWVLHGTPASGAGVIGCLETGVSVIALCENAHHEKYLDIALRERAVESMLAGSRIFKDEALQAKALEFCPMGTSAKQEKEKEKKEQKKEEEEKEDDKSEQNDSESHADSDKKDKKDKKKKKKNKKTKKDKKKGGARKRKAQQSQSGTASGDESPASSSS